MRFKKFLEMYMGYDDFDEEKFRKNCAFYFEQMNGTKGLHLYRGVADIDDIIADVINEFVPRIGPRDSRKDVHDAINNWMEMDFNRPFRNGLFVTGDQVQAEEYGDVFVIVPVGKFEWLSGSVYDLAAEIGFNDIDSVDSTVKELADKTWRNNVDLPNCIKSGNEIMLWCPHGYYAFALHDVPVEF